MYHLHCMDHRYIYIGARLEEVMTTRSYLEYV